MDRRRKTQQTGNDNVQAAQNENQNNAASLPNEKIDNRTIEGGNEADQLNETYSTLDDSISFVESTAELSVTEELQTSMKKEVPTPNQSQDLSMNSSICSNTPAKEINKQEVESSDADQSEWTTNTRKHKNKNSQLNTSGANNAGANGELLVQSKTTIENNDELSDNEKMQRNMEKKGENQKVSREDKRKRKMELAEKNWTVPRGSQTGGKKGKLVEIESNHLCISFKILPKYFYQYDVKFSTKMKKLKMRILAQFIQQHCQHIHPVFDGVQNLYSTSQLPDGETEIVLDFERGDPASFVVTLLFVKTLDTAPLHNPENCDAKVLQPLAQCLNIVLRHALVSMGYQPVSNAFIPQNSEAHELSCGMEMKLGLFQSVVFGHKPLLNVYVKQKAFPVHQNVITTISQLCQLDDASLRRAELEDEKITLVEQFLRQLKIRYEVPDKNNKKREYLVAKLGPTAHRAVFLQYENETTVEKYFRDHKHLPLKYPHMPCISPVNKRTDGLPNTNLILLPPEHCKIIGGSCEGKLPDEVTSRLILLDGMAQDKKEKIMKLFADTEINNDVCVRNFGIEVLKNFTRITSKVLKSPTIQYVNTQYYQSSWQLKLPRDKFYSTATRKISWAIINLDHNLNCPDNPITFDNFTLQMVRVCRDLGLINMEDSPINIFHCKISEFEETLTIVKNCTFVFVIVPNDGIVYGDVKTIAEYQIGCLTQCIKTFTFNKLNTPSCQLPLIINIAQKINAKLNGINHRIKNQSTVLRWPFMIMGADIIHPPAGSTKNSIVAVAASYDRYAFKYNICDDSQEAGTETILRMQSMTCKQLDHFENRNNHKLPEKIVVYRDGVSDGQFSEIYSKEIEDIKKACNKFKKNYNPNITFLVVQKRHNTRFFSVNAKEGNQQAGPSKPTKNKQNKYPQNNSNINVPVGTCVDTIITHPSVLTFYLLSHYSGRGLARPTKYVLLHDENNINIDDLEELTFQLCYLFSRCTKSVSYPAPTYYAHLAAAHVNAYSYEIPADIKVLDDIRFAFRIRNPMFYV